MDRERVQMGVVSVRLAQRELRALRALARAQERTLSALVRRLLRQAIQAQYFGQAQYPGPQSAGRAQYPGPQSVEQSQSCEQQEVCDDK